jgi:probable HAF family extracellular repeat protein
MNFETSRLARRIPTEQIRCVGARFTMCAVVSFVLCTCMAAQENSGHHLRYRVVEIGTFGGPTSLFNGGTRAITDDGRVVGAADTAALDLNAPDNCFEGPACMVQHAWEWREGRLKDLGVLADGYSSYTNAITARGLVVGQSQNAGIDPLTGAPVLFLATVWDHGKIKNLGTLGGGNSIAVAATDQNFVMGAAENGIPDTLGFPGFDGVSEIFAFGWSGGKIFNLGDLGGPGAFPSDMNNHGQVVGTSLTSSVPGPFGVGSTAPFLWENGRGMRNLGSLGGGFGGAAAINERGQVVGGSNLEGDQAQHAFFWEHGKMHDLGGLGGRYSNANQLNKVGEVIGLSTTIGDQTNHAVLWKQGKMIDLGLVSGDNASNAFGINSQGQVVGQSWFWDGHEVTASHAFLWENGGPMVDLNTLVCNSTDLQLIEADLINDSGWIVSYALRPNGDLRAAILIPNCDQDSSDDSNMSASATNGAVGSSRSVARLTPQMKAVLQTRIERSFRRGLPPRSWPIVLTRQQP